MKATTIKLLIVWIKIISSILLEMVTTYTDAKMLSEATEKLCDALNE